MSARALPRLSRRRTARWTPWLAAGVAYLAISLLILAPTLSSFGRAVPGGPVAGVDGWQNVWNLWWFQRALAAGENPFFTHMLFYPEGADLLGQTLSVSNGLLVLPVIALFGPVAGYNTAVLLSFVLSGLGAYALTLHVSGRHLAAFVGGFVFAFSPFHMTKIWDGQLELLAVQWLPLYMLFLVRTASARGRWREALAEGGLLALIGYTSWYYLLFSAVASLLVAALWLPYLKVQGSPAGPHPLPPSPVNRIGGTQIDGRAESGQASRRNSVIHRHGHMVWLAALLRLALAAGLALLLLAPALLPMLGRALEAEGPSASMALLPARSATLLSFFLPSNLHPLLGPLVEPLGAAWHPDIAAWNVALDYSALLLALAALRWARGPAWRWAALALGACLLALGPTLAIGSWQTGIPLPYAALMLLPGFNLSHRPSHFVVITTVALAPLAGLGVRAIQERFAPPRRHWLLGALLLLAIWEQLPPRWQLWEPAPHPYYGQIATEPGALLVLPAEGDVRQMVDQIGHARPVMGGMLARAPDPDSAHAPGIRVLWWPNEPREQLLPDNAAQTLSALNFYGVGHVVVERTRLAPNELAVIETELTAIFSVLPPEFTDQQLLVYRVPPSAATPFAFFRQGWYAEEQADARAWRWMRARGELMLVNPAPEARPVTLQLELESYQRPRELALALEDAPLGRLSVPAQPEQQVLTLHLLLAPGAQRLSLSALEPPELAPEGRMISIVVTDISLRSTP